MPTAKAPTPTPTPQLRVTRPARADPARYAAFLRLLGFESPPAALPLLYPVVESFRLSMLAMSHPAFPFNVLGSVLARNATEAKRAIALDEALTYRWAAPTPQGGVQWRGSSVRDQRRWRAPPPRRSCRRPAAWTCGAGPDYSAAWGRRRSAGLPSALLAGGTCGFPSRCEARRRRPPSRPQTLPQRADRPQLREE